MNNLIIHHTKWSLILIILAGLLAHGNTLKNQFAGDDLAIVIENPFYDSLAKLPLIFTDQYIWKSSHTDYANEGRASGAVSYRPVASVSFFFSRALWGSEPLGWHLENLILHIFNALLVFYLVVLLFNHNFLALLSAIIFVIHPINVETICSMGYRQDLLAGFFVFGGFIFHILSKKKSLCFVGLNVCYFLAVFSKETAVMLPFVLLAYDVLLNKIRYKPYIPLIIITFFYLWIYLFIFPNSALQQNYPVEIMALFEIFRSYGIWIIWPISVKLIPSLYVPPVTNIALNILFMVGFLSSLIIAFKFSKRIFFVLLWFIIFLVPVMNIVPLANPFAQRYMYIPAVGIIIAFSYGLINLTERIFSKNIRYSILIGYLISCIITSIPLNAQWRNSVILAYVWSKTYPNSPQGYLFYGFELYKAGKCEEAIASILKAKELGWPDAQGYFILGDCSKIMGDLDNARDYLNVALKMNPNYKAASNLLESIK